MSAPSAPLFEAISVSSVRKPCLEEAFASSGYSWNEACHITATRSLSLAFAHSGAVACSIATLQDLIVISPDQPGTAISVENFPHFEDFNPEDPLAYIKASGRWVSASGGMRAQLGVRFDDKLREFRRINGQLATNCAILLHSRREFQKTIEELTAAGIEPSDSFISPESDFARTAVKVWRWLEAELPELSRVREVLWEPFSADADESEMKAVFLRVRGALARVFGHRERWLLVHHGFYFYTPPQWALFKLLERCGFVDQLFIIHDDGRTPVFETWRRFFTSKWEMPEPKSVQVEEEPTPSARAFASVWRGNRVDPSSLENLRIYECRSPSELVQLHLMLRTGAGESGESQHRLHAPASGKIRRYIERLSPVPGAQKANLAQLPVGAFLLRLHECIRADSYGSPELVLTGEGLVDMAMSGYLELPGGLEIASSLGGAIRRALPFFGDCRLVSQWIERAVQLERSVIDVSQSLGGREESHSDLERMSSVWANPLRLAPWVDLSVTEAARIRAIVHAIGRLLHDLASQERIRFQNHFEFLVSRIKEGMRNLPAQEREQIEAKLDGFRIGLDGDVDVTGLIDIVVLLLGRDASEDSTGEGPDAVVAPLRSLDAQGFIRTDRSIHLTNMADGSFPLGVQPVGWPFSLDDLVDADPITKELLQTRSECAQMSDLYLLWLALDGVEPNREIVISWISDVGGEPRNPSSVLSMLTVPRTPAWTAVLKRSGGVPVRQVPSAADDPPIHSAPAPNSVDADRRAVALALKRIPVTASAASKACPRRFAIQWALSNSPSFEPEFLQTMLFGNMVGALAKGEFRTHKAPLDLCNDLWRFLSIGERTSSLEKSVVKPGGGPDANWVLTLYGSSYRNEPLDLAYRASRAREAVPVTTADLQFRSDTFLPLPLAGKLAEVCKYCPVATRCRYWTDPDD